MTACYPISFQIMSPNVFKEVCLKEWQRIYKGLKGKYVFSKNRENIWKLLNANLAKQVIFSVQNLTLWWLDLSFQDLVGQTIDAKYG